MPTIHVTIKGKVQGVFFRATAREVACRLQLTGWVKNTKEGHVEAMATGAPLQLQQFVNWCRQGPASAVVTDVIQQEAAPQTFDDFVVIR